MGPIFLSAVKVCINGMALQWQRNNLSVFFFLIILQWNGSRIS